MIIYRHNLNILSQLKPGEILTCDSSLIIRHNIGVGATWCDPPTNLMLAIKQSFEHYFRLFDIANFIGPQTDILYPNLHYPLSGLVTLAETYTYYKINNNFIEDIIITHNKFMNRLDNLTLKYPDFFNKYVEHIITIKECEDALNGIEEKINKIITQSNHPDKNKAEQLKQYVSVLQETVKNCYYTLSQQATNLFKSIIKFYRKLTQTQPANINSIPTSNNEPIKTVISLEFAQKISNIEFDDDSDYIKVDIDKTL